MLRYFYIIFLLISIKYTFCYDYYDVKSSNHRYIGRRDTDRFNNNVNDNKNRKSLGNKHQEAQFDVASFIQNNVEEAAEDNKYPYVYSKRNEYSDYGSLADEKIDESMKMKKKRQDYLNSGHVEAELEDEPLGSLEKRKSFDHFKVLNFAKDEKLQGHNEKMVKKNHDEVSLNHIHNPENKCSFRNMKFPFFSHNTSDKNKKQKRRKIFPFHNKKGESERSKPMELSEPQMKKKRSYEDKLNLTKFCPACKRKFKKKSSDDVARQKRLNDRILHNSRQFYAAFTERAKEKAKHIYTPNNNSDNKNSEISIPIDNTRSKREEINENDKRLKELADIQKNLDRINMSNLLKQN